MKMERATKRGAIEPLRGLALFLCLGGSSQRMLWWEGGGALFLSLTPTYCQSPLSWAKTGM